jgi:hypothetical protein
MTGSCDRAANCQLASPGKTRHFYLARYALPQNFS